MDLLNYDVRRELFGTHPVYTKTRDEVPAIYRSGAEVKNSLVADGCVIEGTVENCVLFRGVHVGRGARAEELHHHAGQLHRRRRRSWKT